MTGTEKERERHVGKYDGIEPAALRTALVAFANALLDLDKKGTLLVRAPELQKMMGDLRQMLFAYEIRCTEKLPIVLREAENQEVENDPVIRASLRIVQEAVKREADLADSWRNGDAGNDSDDR